MKNSRILARTLTLGLIAITTAGIATSAVAAEKAHAATKKAAKPAEPPKPVGELVEYPALESRVGQTLVIETTFKTTRQGKLLKYTQPTLTLDIGSEGHPTEFTVPRETIKSIHVMRYGTEEPAKDSGTSGAKKN